MKNTLLLAVSNILLRVCALVFQAYLAGKIGASQLGIFGIISSVGVVFATISISGVRFSVTRLAAEEVGRDNRYPLSLMKCAFKYAAVFGIAAGAGLCLLSDVISESYIGDASAALPLKIMALSMPAISLGSCVEGYFTAKQKVFRLIAIQLMAQLLRIIVVAVFFYLYLGRGAYPVDILAAGSLVGEVSFAAGMFLLYFAETFRKTENTGRIKHLPLLAKTALPLAISAYMRTGLSSMGQVIIPAGLKKSGMGSGGAFSIYGVITQMAMPVVMFPIAFLCALADVLVPRLTEAQVKGRTIGISYIVNRALRIGMIFSVGVMGIMLFFADFLGEGIYKNSEVGFYIRVFAPLIPIIYLDAVTDGCLKGLGQQLHSMVYNIIEGIINVTLLFFLLPKIAMMGYIVVMYIKEILNAFLSIRRLSKVTSVDIPVLTGIWVITGAFLAWMMTGILAISSTPLSIVLYCVCYITLIYASNSVTRGDLNWIKSLIFPSKYKSLQ